MPEKRQYVRMSTVFPVELEIVREAGENAQKSLLQGFTRDVSAGGMCIELKIFGKDAEKLLERPNSPLRLTINPHFSSRPVSASARVAWLKKEETAASPHYLIGVSYTDIDEKARAQIFDYARRLLWLPRLVAAVVMAMVFISAALVVHQQKLVRENKKLVNLLVQDAEKKSAIASDLYELQERKTRLTGDLSQANQKIKELEAAIASLTQENQDKKTTYEQELAAASEKRRSLGVEIQNLGAGREKLQDAYRTIESKEAVKSASVLQQMHGWLKSHQNRETGLVASFEGDTSLEHKSFTYDQALVAQALLVFKDWKNAEAILSFFEKTATLKEGGFLNAYYTENGSPSENTVNTGPNLWIGIAALQYDHESQSQRFLPLARQIADWAGGLRDAEGGFKGGPGLSWYSTEHNLDAYAFFAMMYESTGEERYKIVRDQTLSWIKKYAYSSADKRMQRGKGDATVATDTFSWAIAAIGPSILKAAELDPEEIMAYAEKNCRVDVTMNRADGRVVRVAGFDFAKAKNAGRGGVLSTEWTAQMIVAYQLLSEYFEGQGDPEKSTLYRDKAVFYLNELQKLLITSPSRTGQGRGCLPYASADNVDTGHGWRTPKGKRTGSLSGTAYGIFAWVRYNPLDLHNEKRVKA